jgi:hypothetical protein
MAWLIMFTSWLGSGRTRLLRMFLETSRPIHLDGFTIISRGCQSFAWQTGYAAFTVSKSQIGAVQRYIANQEAHHEKVTFQEELIALLKAHEIEFDERYLWA